MIGRGYLEKFYQLIKELVKAVKDLSEKTEQMEQEISEQKSSTEMTKEDWELVAFHEIGHAIVAKVLCDNAILETVKLEESSKETKGYNSLEYKNSMFKKTDYLNIIALLLGGMVAEDAIYDEHCAGCRGDLRKAKDAIFYMLNDCGMGKKINYSENYSEELDNEIEEILQQQKARAEKVIKENIDALKGLQKELLHHKELTGEQLYTLFKKYGI